MPLVALATCAAWPALEPDDVPLLDALGRRGVAAVPARWDDPDVEWSRFDAVVIRSTLRTGPVARTLSCCSTSWKECPTPLGRRVIRLTAFLGKLALPSHPTWNGPPSAALIAAIMLPVRPSAPSLNGGCAR